MDFFKFTVSARATYSFFSTGSTDTRGTLYDANYGFLTSDNSSGESDNFWFTRTLDPGTYYVEVGAGFGTNNIGSYQLHLEGPGAGTTTDDHGFSPWSASTMLVGGTPGGSLSLPDDLDFFKFTVSARATYSFFSTGSTDTRGTLYDANYGFLTSDNSSGESDNFWFTRTLDPGTYYVEVSGNGSFGGDYALHIEDTHQGPTGLDDTFPFVHLGKDDFSREMARFSRAAYSDHASKYDGTLLSMQSNWAPVRDLHVAGGLFSDGVFISGDRRAAAHLYIGEVDSLRTLVVAFRGTDSGADVVDWLPLSNHYDRFSPLFPALREYLNKYSIESVLVTGHSLGGAMAQFLMADAHDVLGRTFLGATFGSPGAGFLDNTDSRLVHYEHFDDPVPEIGWSAGNRVSGYLFEIDLMGNGVSVKEEHSIERYITTVDLLSQAGIDFTPVAAGTAINDPDAWALFPGTIGPDDFDAVSVPLATAKHALIYGQEGNDRLGGTRHSDIFNGGPGDDEIDGEEGIDKAIYVGPRSAYAIEIDGGRATVRALTGYDGFDRLTGIERLEFSDSFIAIDVGSSAGTVAKIIGATFGRAAVANPEYMGIGLASLDSGMTSQDLMQLALNARLGAGASAAAVVQLLYTNVVGIQPSAAERDGFVDLISRGDFTVASLGMFAAESLINQTAIGLTGMMETGLEFIPYGG